MTLWEFCNNHCFVALVLGVVSLGGLTLVTLAILASTGVKR